MTTNFYWHEPDCEAPCRHCPGADVLHIGHFAGPGWSFEGHFKDGSPWLVSFADWATFLRGDAGQAGWIRDEYGAVWHDVDAFLTDVEAVPAPDRRRQHDWLVAHSDRVDLRAIGQVKPGCDWLDADGFSFHGGEFT